MEGISDVNTWIKLKENAQIAFRILDKIPQSPQTDYERAFFTLKEAKQTFKIAKKSLGFQMATESLEQTAKVM